MRFGRTVAAVAILVLVGGGIWWFVGPGGTEEEFPWGLHIVVFEVGQADAIALVSPGGGPGSGLSGGLATVRQRS